jgi:hypothetical protein
MKKGTPDLGTFSPFVFTLRLLVFIDLYDWIPATGISGGVPADNSVRVRIAASITKLMNSLPLPHFCLFLHSLLLLIKKVVRRRHYQIIFANTGGSVIWRTYKKWKLT